MSQPFPFLGSVIYGTMRNKDLIPAFLSVLEDLDPDKASVLSNEWSALDSDEETEKASDLLDEIWTLLDDHAPEGYYFGAHQGGGADYGYWEAIDGI